MAEREVRDVPAGPADGDVEPARAVAPTVSSAHVRAVAPATRYRGRGRRTVRVLSWTALVTSVLVLLATVGVVAYVARLSSNITRVAIPRATGADGKPVATAGSDQPQNILLVGADSRANLTPAQLQRFHTTYDPGGGSDTVMLLHISPARDKAIIVSIPRDTYVPIPGHDEAKINYAYDAGEAAHKGGGPALLVSTVEQLSGLTIDHYVQVGLLGFSTIVDELGGVDICLRQADYDPESGLDLSAGEHRNVDGPTALSFVRARKTVNGGDLGRIKRQQQFIGAVVRKITSAGTLANPVRLNSVLTTATRSLSVDSGLSTGDLLSLADRLRRTDPAHIEFTTLPIAGEKVLPQAGDVLLRDQAADDALFAALRADVDPGQPIPTPSATAPGGVAALPVAPGQVSVHVVNGSGVAGAAASAGRQLAGYGFGVLDPPGNTTSPGESSQVRYPPGSSAAAQTLQAAVPGSVLRADASVPTGTVELVLGTGFGGVVDPAIPAASRPTARPSPTVSVSPPPVDNAATNTCSQ